MRFVRDLPFPSWTVVIPPVALIVLAVTWGHKPPGVVLALVGIILAGAVLAAVHHAEVVAHRVGEPFGSLVLAVAVTVIEVALIVTLMVSSPSETTTLARDTVFAAVMSTCNGIVGLSLLAGTLRTRVAASFDAEGTATALATVSTLAALTLVLPTFTTSRPGPLGSASARPRPCCWRSAWPSPRSPCCRAAPRCRRAASTSCCSRASCSSR